MLCVTAFFAGDKSLAVDLANWLETLGGVQNHDCLLVVDSATGAGGVVEPLKRAFKSVDVITSQPAGAQGTWGQGTTDATAANEMFLTASIYIQHKLKRRWLMLEPDAVPIRPTWLDEIEAEDKLANRPFMGAFVNIPPHEPHMSGNAVYPACIADYSMDMAIPGKIAWDYAGRRDTAGKKKAHFTDLIQHEYRIHGEAPTFPTPESLSVIKPRTAIFHRCKDGTLIARLRERLALARESQPKEQAETPREATLLERIAALEKQLAAIPLPLPMPPSAEDFKPRPFPKNAGSTIHPSRRKKAKAKRTPEQQAIIDARMAKARAARKKNLTGVK